MRKSKLVEQLKFIRLAAIKAGIWEYTFLGYGSMLGAVRERGIIDHDNDADVCILSDMITEDQERLFYDTLVAYDMFKHRERVKRRSDTGRLVWTSLKRFKEGMKTCIWYQFRWNGMYWHTKGSDWTKKLGTPMGLDVSKYSALAKGIPESYFYPLQKITWYGQDDWKIPTNCGHALDFMYPDWLFPKKGGASASSYILSIPNWSETKGWSVKRR